MPVLDAVGIGTYLTQKGWYGAASATVAGFDMALVSSGWAVIRQGNLRAGFWAPTQYRCGMLARSTEELLRDEQPEVIAVEDATFQKSYETYQIGMGSGAILSEVDKYRSIRPEVGLLKVHPTRLKYFAHRSKEADKTHVQKLVKDMLNVCGVDASDFLPVAKRQLGDVCDAIGLALMGYIAYGINKGTIQASSLGKNADFFTTSEKNLCLMLRDSVKVED